jgi:hypothetical protein
VTEGARLAGALAGVDVGCARIARHVVTRPTPVPVESFERPTGPPGRHHHGDPDASLVLAAGVAMVAAASLLVYLL